LLFQKKNHFSSLRPKILTPGRQGPCKRKILTQRRQGARDAKKGAWFADLRAFFTLFPKFIDNDKQEGVTQLN